MKILYPDIITAATVNSTAKNYDPAFLLDDSQKKIWKSATVNTVILEFTIDGNINCFTLFNTNIKGNYSLYDETDTELESGELTLLTDSHYTFPCIWQELQQTYTDAVKLVITTDDLTDDDFWFCGVARAGVLAELSNPRYGLSGEPVSYSIVGPLHYGGKYVKKRDIVWAYTAELYTSLIMGISDAFTFFRQMGEIPVPVRLASEYDIFLFASAEVGNNRIDNNRRSVISVRFEETL